MWKYIKKLKEPDSVKSFINKYNVILPSELIKLLETNNGGRPDLKEIFTVSGKEHLFKALFSYNAEDKEIIYSVYPGEFEGTTLYPIGSDPAGNIICFDTIKKVFVFWDHETGDYEPITKMPF